MAKSALLLNKITFSGLIGKPNGWQKVKVLTSKQHAPSKWRVSSSWFPLNPTDKKGYPPPDRHGSLPGLVWSGSIYGIRMPRMFHSKDSRGFLRGAVLEVGRAQGRQRARAGLAGRVLVDLFHVSVGEGIPPHRRSPGFRHSGAFSYGTKTRPSREGLKPRLVPTCSVVNFSRGILPPQKGKRALLGDLEKERSTKGEVLLKSGSFLGPMFI